MAKKKFRLAKELDCKTVFTSTGVKVSFDVETEDGGLETITIPIDDLLFLVEERAMADREYPEVVKVRVVPYNIFSQLDNPPMSLVFDAITTDNRGELVRISINIREAAKMAEEILSIHRQLT